MIADKVIQGFEEGILALAYGVSYETYQMLLRDQEDREEYEFCAGMVKALEVWTEKKDKFNCRANLRNEESQEDYSGEL